MKKNSTKNAAEPAPTPTPVPGLFRLYDLSGPRADVRARAEALTGITEKCKAYLLELIDALPAECYGVEINAFGSRHEQGARRVLLNHQFSVVGIS